MRVCCCSVAEYIPLPAGDTADEHSSSTAVDTATDGESRGDHNRLIIEDTARLAGWFCFLWFIANWTITASVEYTTISSMSILSSVTSELSNKLGLWVSVNDNKYIGFFTLAIGRLLHVESLTKGKILASVVRYRAILPPHCVKSC